MNPQPPPPGQSVSASQTALTQYCAAREAALAPFLEHHRIRPLWQGLTKATDQLLRHVAGNAAVTIIATGGYGRGELFPFSDVDVLLLVPEHAPANVDAALLEVLQQLWDMQVPVSHATRTIAQTIEDAKRDDTIAAALMDARYISGDRKAYLALKARLRAEVFGQSPHEFVSGKLSERDRRHAKWGDSRFMLEPNIKEGKGGLRDLQTLTWLARYCYHIPQASDLVREDLLTHDEWQHYREAYLFFSQVRGLMHALRVRADDRLTFDLQIQIAERLNFPGRSAQEKAEKFMLRYFQYAREVGALTRIFCALLEDENLRVKAAPFATGQEQLGDFVREGDRLHFARGVDLTKAPSHAVALFYVAQQHGLDIHPRAQLAITRAMPQLERQLMFEGRANQLFLEMLLSPRQPETTLRRMSETGVLGALIPEFGRITGMMQYDGYHTYTVDEHTLVAVGNLTSIEAGSLEREMPLATALAREVGDRAPLYLAMLCHDLAKGTGGQHAEKGEAIVARIAARLGMNPAQGELAGWLVKHHLMLSETAFKRDIDDAQTIRDFVALVQSPERLRLLLLITVADIKAVGPTIWNRWKGALMRDLYHRAAAQMGVGYERQAATGELRTQLLQEVPPSLAKSATDLLAEQLPASWWQRPVEEQIASIEAYGNWKKLGDKIVPVITHDRFRGITEITCCMEYAPTLFRDLAGVMAWIGASIVSARSMVLGSGIMIVNFGVQDVHGNHFEQDERRLRPLPQLIEQARSGALNFADELPRRKMVSRGREVAVESSVFIDNQVSAVASVIEVNARDRLGLLYDILGAINDCQLQVMTTHVATYGKKAVDVFYVKDAFGIKVIHRNKLAEIQQKLLAACGN